ncbi:MAG: PaaI family thioesterase [Armatimonadetes bacterium]|nr:PaaI family thioesterase [Armatimonadota bacterium]
MELLDDGWCFACGKKNPIGLKLEFEKLGEEYIARFTPGKEHQGYTGITHGGVVATILDEAMARLVWAEGYSAVTAEMTMRLKLPARTGEELIVAGRIVGEDRRTLTCSAEAKCSDGRTVAEASARMMKI